MLAVLQAADLWSTAWGVQQGAVETNPLVLEFGWGWAMLAKAFVILACFFVSERVLLRPHWNMVMMFLSCVWAAVVINNLIAGVQSGR